MRFHSVLMGFTLAALVCALAGPAGARSINTIEGWDLDSTPKTCTMTTTFSDDVTIGLVLSPSTSELGFMAAVPQALAPGGGKTAPIVLTFDGAGPYTHWEEQKAAVVNGEDKVAVIANWGAEHADDLAKTVAAASHVAIRVGERDLGSYDLSGSPAAYRALTRCGSQLAAR